jgi:3-deoxy-D-arabino-heptulosonate 7-phosphate (DAHP) synthase
MKKNIIDKKIINLQNLKIGNNKSPIFIAGPC